MQKNDHFFNVTNWAKLNVTNWAKLVSKKTNLAQLVTFKNCARTFLLKKSAEPLFYSVFDNNVKNKANLAQLVTIKKAKLGPDNNSTTCIYIYIYIYMYIEICTHTSGCHV